MRAWGSVRAGFSRRSCAEGAGPCLTAWDAGAAFVDKRRCHGLHLTQWNCSGDLAAEQPKAVGSRYVSSESSCSKTTTPRAPCFSFPPSHVLCSFPQPHGQARFLSRPRRCSLSRGQRCIAGNPLLPPTNALFTPPSHPKHLPFIVLFNTCQLLILPCATGMTISLVLLALCSYRPRCRAVIWLRIDQKTCLKSIYTAGCTAHVVSNRIDGDNVVTDLEGLAAAIAEIGADNVLAVISTTSCFAPRRPDDVKSVAKLCKDAQIPHVVNHAYGLQDAQTNKLLCSAGSLPYFERHIDTTHCECSLSATVGRVDCVISSTDKNFLVCAGCCVFETHVVTMCHLQKTL